MSLLQTMLKINWPAHIECPPAMFREKLAKSDLPSEFFNYGTEIKSTTKVREIVGGKFQNTSKESIIRHFDKPVPLPGRSPLRIVGSKRWSGILADPGSEDLVLGHTREILGIAMVVAGQPVKAIIDNPEFGITYTKKPVKYMLREMVVHRRGKQARNADLGALLAERIFGGVAHGVHGIEGICSLFDFEMPERDALAIRVNPLRNIGLRLRTADDLSNEYCSLVDAEVWMNADLRGYWQVGNLAARGYGRLIRHWEASPK